MVSGDVDDSVDKLSPGDFEELVGEGVGTEPLQQAGDVECVAADLAGVALSADALADAQLDGDERRRTRDVTVTATDGPA